MTDYRALIIDDEADIRELLNITLAQLGLEVVEADCLQSAYDLLERQQFDFCLTDMRLPDGDGLTLVSRVQSEFPGMPIAVITAHGNTDLAVEALRRGAFDFVSKPVQLTRLREMVQNALQLRQAGETEPSETGLTGDSSVMQALRRQISRVTRSQAPVFISGESGTGKELVARAIHYQGPRGQGPFIAVNCGAIPGDLMESEFFGHRKGSFTGAIHDKQGLFQAADGGTLFLDEVADLPLSMQVKLLRAIQEKSVRAIGSHGEKSVDVRILSATHKNLSSEVSNGRFREDLFYRINVIEIKVPPLRERREDISRLAEVFLNRFAEESGLSTPVLSKPALEVLMDYPFPGNVRELENTLERAFTLCDNGFIEPDDLGILSVNKSIPGTGAQAPESQSDPVAGFAPGTEQSLDDYLADIERRILVRTLEENRWNKTASAEKLGLTFRQFRYKLQKLNID